MGIDYAERPEMASMSKETRELYFAALELLELHEFAAGMELLPDAEADAVNRLSTAVGNFQGKELANGSDNSV